MTLATDIEEFLRRGVVQGWSAHTRTAYSVRLGLVTPILRRRGCRTAADVTPADLDAGMATLLDQGLRRSTRVAVAAVIRRFFRFLQEEGRILANPACVLPVPDDGEEPLPAAPPTEEQVRTLLDTLPRSTVADVRWRALLELLYSCGLRLSEALAMNLDDLDLVQHTVHVRHGKGGQERVLPVTETAGSALQDYLAVRKDHLKGPDHGAVFLNAWGKRLSDGLVRAQFRTLNQSRPAGMPYLRAHLFRHAIAVHLLRGKADVRVIQAFLGHASLDTTTIYLRLVPGELREHYDRAMPEIAVGLT